MWRPFGRRTSRTPSMLSRSSQSVALNFIDLMDGSLAKYISMALMSNISIGGALGHLSLPFEENENVGA